MPPKTKPHTTILTGLMEQKEVAEIVGISMQTIHMLTNKAKGRGYDPSDYRTLRLEHVIDEPGRGPESKVMSEEQIVTNDKSVCESSTRTIGGQFKLIKCFDSPSGSQEE